MFEAFVVYLTLLAVLLILARCEKLIFENKTIFIENNYFTISYISILIFSLIIGLRYYVGGDYHSYVELYKSLNINSFTNQTHTEFGFFMLMYFLKFLCLPFPFLFITTSFIQIFFVYKWCRNYKFLLFWIVYFYFTSLYLFESMNIIRQAIAFSLILFSIPYVYKSRFFQFITIVFTASLFHKSALFFLPFYFFIKKDWIKNKYTQILLLTISIFSAKIIIKNIFENFELIAFFLNYEGYTDLVNRNDLLFKTNSSTIGLSYILNTAINFIIILYSDKLKKTFKDYNYIAYHNLFLIIAFFYTASTMSNSIVVSRTLFYFNSFRLVVLSFLCYFLFSVEKKTINYIIGFIIILFFFIYFLSAITNGAAWCAPFRFISQYDL